MQAYANAELAPHKSELRFAPKPLAARTVPLLGDDEPGARAEGVAAPSAVLASLILDGLDDQGLAVLARRLRPFLEQEGKPNTGTVPAAYTVATLAAELDMSAKAIRCAIARRELAAIKRGSRWIISPDAVHSWATAAERRCATRHPRRAAAPKLAGPSLRSALCGATSTGGAR